MDRLILEVNKDQKETLVKLFKMLRINVKVLPIESGKPKGDQEKFESTLKSCLGMWKDLDMDFESYRHRAWGGRGT
jgi:hypothetical protein